MYIDKLKEIFNTVLVSEPMKLHTSFKTSAGPPVLNDVCSLLREYRELSAEQYL